MPSDYDALINNLEQLLKGQLQPIQKDYYDISDAANYLGLTKNYMHKLNFRKEIPYYKAGKKCYYSKADLDLYITKNRIKSRHEIDATAQTIVNQKSGR